MALLLHILGGYINEGKVCQTVSTDAQGTATSARMQNVQSGI